MLTEVRKEKNEQSKNFNKKIENIGKFKQELQS